MAESAGGDGATLVDLTHAIPPWDVVTAAITIRTSFSFFPVGAIHLIVVQSVVVVLVFAVVLVSFLIDLAYLFADPRLRGRRA